jgi:hypothetical protein
MAYIKATALAWRNKVVMLLTTPTTSNIGVSLHELYSQKDNHIIIDNNQCKTKKEKKKKTHCIV